MLLYTMTKRRIMKISIVLLSIVIITIIIATIVLNAITCSATGKKIPIYSVGREDKKIAITFDCAWGNSNTEDLLKILKNEEVKATFFVTGDFCDSYSYDVKCFFEDGHEIANHSDKHPHVAGMNINELIKDTRECANKIKDITGSIPSLYRAPYGEYDDNFMTTIEGMGYKVIQWSVDSIDWQKPDVKTIISRTTENIESGDILLFHNDLENTTKALPEIIKKLKSDGFELVSVSELIYEKNYEIKPDGTQIQTVTDVYSDFRTTYSNNYYVNSAMEKIRTNLTLEEIYALSVPEQKVILLEKTRYLLTNAEIAAIYSLQYEELYEAYVNLVIAAETYGAAEDYTSYEQDSSGYSIQKPETTETEIKPDPEITDKSHEEQKG